MKFNAQDPPRIFSVTGAGVQINISDCGSLELNPNEQVTFKTEAGSEYDVVRKSWGFYATPSINGRLKSFGLRGVLVMSKFNKIYLLLVESDKEKDFFEYIESDFQTFICWLDDGPSLEKIINLFK